MGDNDTPDARSVDRTEHSGPAGTAEHEVCQERDSAQVATANLSGTGHYGEIDPR